MSIAPAIYDWPSRIRARSGFFRVGPEVIDGGMTISSALISNATPGGRAILQAEFDTLAACANGMGSWLASLMATQAVFRVPIRVTPQLLSGADLGLDITAADERLGLPFDNDENWDNDFGWAFDPAGTALTGAIEGTTVLTLDSALDPLPFFGKAIGVGDCAYLVFDAESDGTMLTLTVMPPLRADVAAGDLIKFRPTMLATVLDPSAFLDVFKRNRWFQPGAITFVEALL